MNNIFKFIELDNGDILLKRNNIDDDIYEIIINDDDTILLKKNKYVRSLLDLKKYDFSKSKIIKCIIEDNHIEHNKYRSIVNYIYEIIGDGSKIIKTSVLNIKTTNIQNKGFYYNKILGISIQGADSNKTIYEILY